MSAAGASVLPFWVDAGRPPAIPTRPSASAARRRTASSARLPSASSSSITRTTTQARLSPRGASRRCRRPTARSGHAAKWRRHRATTAKRRIPTSRRRDPNLEARLAELERQLKEAQRSQGASSRAAREAARAQPRERGAGAPRDEELGYVSTDDSFSKILSDVATELSDRFSDAREAPCTKARLGPDRRARVQADRRAAQALGYFPG